MAKFLWLAMVVALWPRSSASAARELEEVAGCLDEARARLRSHEERVSAMTAELLGTLSYPVWREGATPFLPFEGAWAGTWGAIPVEQLWRSVDAETQLVVVNDGGELRRGINLVHEGQICGIVMDAAGNERLHRGYWSPATGELIWVTPERVYVERVSGAGFHRTYEIRELVPGPRGLRVGIEATYRPLWPCSRYAAYAT
ncbi:MAG: hypothetical protein AAGE52_02305 [Myxococcota bacterium]